MSVALGFQTMSVKQVVIDYTECNVTKNTCEKDLDKDSEEANTFP